MAEAVFHVPMPLDSNSAVQLEGDWVKSLTKLKMNNLYFPPLINRSSPEKETMPVKYHLSMLIDADYSETFLISGLNTAVLRTSSTIFPGLILHDPPFPGFAFLP